MPPWLKYNLFGLLLMAPQEFVVNLARKSHPANFLLALLGWFAMLSMVYFVFSRMSRVIKGRLAFFFVSVAMCALLALFVEWFLIGNSPWANPMANQIGLFAGWISVFILPRAFLGTQYKVIRRMSVVWYALFVVSMMLPLAFSKGNGPIVAVTIYGYVVIPFLFLTLAYGFQSGRARD